MPENNPNVTLDWSTFTPHAFAALMDLDYDFPWDDSSKGVACGGCHSQWQDSATDTSRFMDHYVDCPYMDGVHIQAKRREFLDRDRELALAASMLEPDEHVAFHTRSLLPMDSPLCATCAESSVATERQARS